MHSAMEFQSFPCAALLGEHAEHCGLSRKRRNVSSKESIHSAGVSHGFCGYLRSVCTNEFIPVVFSASNKNAFEGTPRQNRTVNGDMPYCYFRYIGTRKGCKFTFWSPDVCVHVPGYPCVSI